MHLKYRTHPGCVYALLPVLAVDADPDQRAWLTWLNGNTQNVVTTLLLYRAAPRPTDWAKAVAYWNDHFKDLEWDTDRRHQKGKFGEATEDWFLGGYGQGPAKGWETHTGSWEDTWRWATAQPHMGRLSSWSMIEYARILLGETVPDAADFMLRDKAGSRSHRNGLGLIAGYDATFWDAGVPDMLGIVPDLEALAEDLLAEARERNPGHPDVTRLTMESALCTWKGWHKPNRRYPNVYADMMFNRIKRAEGRFGDQFQVLWDARREHLPAWLRLEDNPRDPGLSPVKQNLYLTTGAIPLLHREWPDMEPTEFDEEYGYE